MVIEEKLEELAKRSIEVAERGIEFPQRSDEDKSMFFAKGVGKLVKAPLSISITAAKGAKKLVLDPLIKLLKK
jgi:hypothetical protein